jgi:murein DD-endopeptidase MepM/ murein hydrolase activator NlpD
MAPSFFSAAGKPAPAGRREGETPDAPSTAFRWGNLVVIEHRLPDGQYFTSIYGHLGNNRLVKQGDLVAASRQIGSIGEKNVAINGGFDPHLHFGVLQGRAAEPGCSLGDLHFAGRATPVKLVDVAEEQVEIATEFPLGYLTRGGKRYPVTVRGGKYYVSAQVLWDVVTRPGFDIAGYARTTEGWLDPVAFLRDHGAARNPAPPRPRKPAP